MTLDAVPLDIGAMPELARLAWDVHTSGRPRLLRLADEDIALLVPARRKRRTSKRGMSPVDRAAFLASAGSWQNVDTDALVAHIYRERERGDRPPVQL